MAESEKCDSDLLIYRHLWVVGVVVEDRIIFKNANKVVKASRVNSEIGTEDLRSVEFVIMKQEVKLCTILVDFIS